MAFNVFILILLEGFFLFEKTVLRTFFTQSMFYHIFFLQQSTILYFELIEIIFNRYMSQSDIHKEIDAQFIFFFLPGSCFLFLCYVLVIIWCGFQNIQILYRATSNCPRYQVLICVSENILNI